MVMRRFCQYASGHAAAALAVSLVGLGLCLGVLAYSLWVERDSSTYFFLMSVGLLSAAFVIGSWDGVRKLNIKLAKVEELNIEVAHFKQVQRTEAQKLLQLDRILELSRMEYDQFSEFLEDFESRLDKLHGLVQDYLGGSDTSNSNDVVRTTYRDFHSLKGMAGMLDLQILYKQVNESEDVLSLMLNQNSTLSRDQAMAILIRIEVCRGELKSYEYIWKQVLGQNTGVAVTNEAAAWLNRLIDQITKDDGQNGSRRVKINYHELTWLQWEIERAIAGLDSCSMADYVPQFEKLAGEAAADTGKLVHPIAFKMETIPLSKHMASRVYEMLMHFLKNSIEHGIESPEDRKLKGKSALGQIEIEITQVGDELRIKLLDDGRGIDSSFICERARHKGLITEEQSAQMTEDEKLALIFYPGFSTMATVSKHSGRGVGMDAVLSMCRHLGGEIALETKIDRGTKTTISLPFEQSDYLTPYSVVNVVEMVRRICGEYREVLGNRGLKILDFKFDEAFYYFGDRVVLDEALKQMFRLLLEAKKAGETIWLDHSRHIGRRQLDSHEFFRLGFLSQDRDPSRMVPMAQMPVYEGIAQSIAASNGTGFFFDGGRLEFNLPSNMPLPFSSVPLRIGVYSKSIGDISAMVDRYCKKTLSGWDYELMDSEIIPRFLAKVDLSLEGQQALSLIASSAAMLVVAEADLGSFNQESRGHERALATMDLLVVRNGLSSRDILGSEIPDHAIVVDGPLTYPGMSCALERFLLRTFTRKAITRGASSAEGLPKVA